MLHSAPQLGLPVLPSNPRKQLAVLFGPLHAKKKKKESSKTPTRVDLLETTENDHP